MGERYCSGTLPREKWPMLSRIKIHHILEALDQHPGEGENFFIEDITINVGTDGVITIYDDDNPDRAHFWKQFDSYVELEEWIDDAHMGRITCDEGYDFLAWHTDRKETAWRKAQ